LPSSSPSTANSQSFDLPADAEATAQALIDTSLDSKLAYEIVESLTTDIGPRLAGSDDEARARGWGARLGEELGFDRVAIEPFAMPFWERGASQADA
jgi:hypothetical protein